MQPTDDKHIKIENGRYYLRYRRDGINIDGLLLQSTTLLDAQQEKINIVKKYLNSVNYSGPNTTISGLSRRYLEYQEKRFNIGKLKFRSFKEKQSIFETYLQPYFGGHTPSQVTKAEWLSFVGSPVCKGVRNFKNLRKVLTNFLHWCSDPENGRYIEKPPTFELPSHKERSKRILTLEEIQKVYECFEHSDPKQLQDVKDIWMLLSVTGCRKMEIQGASWGLVDTVNWRLITKHEDSATKTKREITLPLAAKNILLRRMKEKYSQYVFGDRNNPSRPYHPDHFQNQLHRAVARAQLNDIQFKDLRSTFANMIIEHGQISISDAVKHMGHSEDVLAKHYLDNARQASDRVAEVTNRVAGLRLVK